MNTPSNRIKEITHTAIMGLQRFYHNYDKIFPYTAKINNDVDFYAQGYSFRYAVISHIGISKWLIYHPHDKQHLPTLWGSILSEISKVDDIGDIALSLWAGCEKPTDTDIEIIIDKLINLWCAQKEGCNSVELGWILKACLMAIELNPESYHKLISVMKESYVRLCDHYNPTAQLFRRHKRKGFIQKIYGQIACFADQVYPIIAMSHYGKLYDDHNANTISDHVVNKICEYQGKYGQWMWHYDVMHNRLCEEYPVFSVHQDAMAPMAIFASDEVNHQDHGEAIELGMQWIFGNNELGKNLVLQEQGIIWRDIERVEPQKRTRNIKGLCCTYGIKSLGDRLTKKYMGNFKINYECRPYHLGWILYAWADKLKT